MTRAKTIINTIMPAREERLYFLLLVIITAAIAVVNAITAVVDAERAGVAIDTRLPWLYETSSAVALLSLYPFLLLAVRHMPVTVDNWKTHLPLYFAFSALFSAAHIAGMVAIRKVFFWLYFEGPYIFFEDVIRESAYEYRKDLVTFGMVVALSHIALAKLKPADSNTPKRLALKSGSQTILLNPEAFRFAKAAGNYVEISVTGGETHLVRLTLAALEKTLSDAGVRAVRIHRSYVIATQHVAEVTPKGDGDAALKLSDGLVLPVSRRYRKQLTGAL
ncbi:LytR/AlgR family response regulator transcription factor [Kordiimonas aestuarii]|uniref:LytR/AlgR family response regulator transcription factor n=1 Tax=Kordiimonas aestuarii TaxID=1005925 RepID=UPI0021CE377F|nr:LytTR family DNA-binding domain-containing protein [Kordiimonas aestuarii]